MLQIPVGTEADFKGVIDLVAMKALLWPDDAEKGDAYDTVDIPASHAEAAREWRDRLLETIAENDDALMELYLEGTEPTEEQLIAGIRRATLASKVTPVVTGSAFKNKGVQPMLDAVVALPARRRIDVGAIEGHAVGKEDEIIAREPDKDAPLSDAGLQDRERPAPRQAHLHPDLLRHARRPASQVLNSTKGSKERIGKIYRMHANKREEIEKATRRPDRRGDGSEEHHHRRHAVRSRGTR